MRRPEWQRIVDDVVVHIDFRCGGLGQQAVSSSGRTQASGVVNR